jgi:Cof subfamily protein (haloacid dehalogenase superfamily)
MKYKLICTDMDGTLLDENHNVSEENREALKKATELGVKVAITTGRLFTSARHYSEIIGVMAPIISANGAYIREKDRDEVIYESTLNRKQFQSIVDVVKKYELRIYFNTHDTIITEEELPENHTYNIMNKAIEEDKKIKIDVVGNFNESFQKYESGILKAIMFGADEDLNKVRKELSEIGGFELVRSWKGNLEVMKEGTTKGNGVKILAEILGIKQEEIICIGDNENDLSMIKYAGLGVAMGNAEEFIKKQADYVTETNSNHGVAKVIEKFILKL